MIILIMLGILFLCLIFTVPIAVSLGISCISVFELFYPGRDMVSMLAQATVTSIDSFSLLAIPFFMLVGSLMEGGGIAQKLIDVANMITGKRAGGLASAAVVASCFFAAISGSGPATVAAIGALTIPAMVERGYDKYFSAALVAAAGCVGVMIPPSNPFVVYGISAQVSIGDLFMSGIGPGIMVGIVLMSYC